MDGKTKPTSSKLTPENVCFDVTTGATADSPDSLPLVYSTGYVISFTAGDNALPIDRNKVPWSGIGVFTKGNQANFLQADETGTVANLMPTGFNSGKNAYQQVTPEVAPPPAPQYVALDQKSGFQKYTLGMAQTSLDPNDVDEGYATPDGYCYGVKQFDKQIGSAEIKNVRLYFSEGLLKEIWVSVEGEPNKVGLKEALIAAYGQPQDLSGMGGSYPVWAGAHTQVKLTGFLGDDTTAIFSSTAVDLQIKALMEQKAQQGAAQGAKNL